MIQILSQIKFLYSDELNSNATISNKINGRVTASSPAIVGEMLIDHADSMSWVLDETTGPAFNLDVVSLINNASAGEINAIHVQCHKIIEDNDDNTDPVRFGVTLGAVDLGEMSQFQLTNMKNFSQSTLTIDSVEVQAGEKALLIVVFSLDKA